MAPAALAAPYSIPAGNPYAGNPTCNPPSGVTPCPEVWLYGLRNPFRWSFDRSTGDILIGDVGQQDQEEVDHFPAGSTSGRNFEWDCKEGTTTESGCVPPDPRPPVFTYPNPGTGAAITGGVVVRDQSVSLKNRYLYVDFFSSDIRSRTFPDFMGDASTGLSRSSVAAFGEDASGRVYVVSLGGTVERIEGSPAALNPIAGTFQQPLYLTAPPADPTRAFVVEKGGQIELLVNDVQQTTPFLDITSLVDHDDNESGLLGMAFAPDYATSGLFYVYFVDTDSPHGDIHVEEFRRSTADANVADPTSRRLVLEIEHSSQGNHYGGTLQSGPDGSLYIGTGDGGGVSDPDNNAQNVKALLGKVLRIDPRETSASPPPPPPPVAPPTPPPPPAAADTTPPRPLLGGRRVQKLSRRRSVVVSAGCTEDCRARVFGTISVPGAARVYSLRGRQLTLTAGTRTRVILVIPRSAVRPLRRALARGRSVTALVTLRVRDSAGNSASVLRRFKARR